MHGRVRLKSALHGIRTSLALILVLLWGMSIVIILSFVAIGVLWVVGWHAIILKLLLIHKGGLPMLLELTLTVVIMPLIIIMMVLLLNLGW